MHVRVCALCVCVYMRISDHVHTRVRSSQHYAIVIPLCSSSVSVGTLLLISERFDYYYSIHYFKVNLERGEELSSITTVDIYFIWFLCVFVIIRKQ